MCGADPDIDIGPMNLSGAWIQSEHVEVDEELFGLTLDDISSRVENVICWDATIPATSTVAELTAGKQPEDYIFIKTLLVDGKRYPLRRFRMCREK